MRYALPLTLIFMLSGCADSHSWTPQSQFSAKLSANDRIYISTPADGEYGDHVYMGSGRNTAKIISSAINAKSRYVRTGGIAENVEDALAQAQHANQDILIFPTILHWEDRATEWSMIPDKVEIKIDVVQAHTGNLINSVIIQGTSGLSTLGGDHPQDLLPHPVAEFASSIF